jgi:hypothetical protein
MGGSSEKYGFQIFGVEKKEHVEIVFDWLLKNASEEMARW